MGRALLGTGLNGSQEISTNKLARNVCHLHLRKFSADATYENKTHLLRASGLSGKSLHNEVSSVFDRKPPLQHKVSNNGPLQFQQRLYTL